MCKYLTKFLFLLFMATSFSVVAKNDVVKVYDKGMDGKKRYYRVVCPDGNSITITQMFGEYGKSARSGGITPRPSIDPTVDEEDLETPTRRDSSNTPLQTTSSSGSVQQATEGLKRKLLKLIGAKSKVEVCMNSGTQCNSYESIDVAAKAACDMIR